MEIPFVRRELLGIEYPMIVKNVDKAIKSLGGTATITKTYLDPQRRMELWFRYNDPYCSTTCADRLAVHNIVIKIKRRKRKKPSQGDASEMQYSFKAEVIGTMSAMYKFSGNANFQYLPMKRVETPDGSSKYESLIEELRLPGLVSTAWLKKPVDLFIPPPIFSRMDQPTGYNYQQKSADAQHVEVHGKSVIAHGRKRRFHHTHFACFEDPDVPTEAFQAHLEAITKVYERQFNEALKIFADERPIWSKNALSYKFDWSPEQFKKVLPCVAYFWLTGPWRSMWCTFGYDPRKDSKAKIYQTIDFRMRGRANWDLKQIKPKRSTYYYYLPNTVVRNSSNSTVPVIETSTFGSEWSSQRKSAEAVKDNVYIFRPGVLPAYRQMFYQALDIHMPEVQEIIHSNDGKENQCREVSGWLMPNSTHDIRELMSKTLESVMEVGVSDRYVQRARDSKGRLRKKPVPKKRKKVESSSDSDVNAEEFDDFLDEMENDMENDIEDEEDEKGNDEDEKEDQNEMVEEILQFMEDARIEQTKVHDISESPVPMDTMENS